MVCQHLHELYELCEKNQLRLGSADLIRIVCKQCNQEETCPSVLSDEYDSCYHEHQLKQQPKEQSDSTQNPPRRTEVDQ
jgi:hypothetical protein